MHQIEQILDEITKRYLESIFPNFALEQEVQDKICTEEMVVVASFKGDLMHGALGMTAPAGTVAATYPLGNTRSTDLLYDWLVEIANQTLGQIKRELAHYGLELWLTVPIALRGISIKFSGCGEEELRRYVFRGRCGDISIWVDFHYQEDLQLNFQEDTSTCQAGEILLF